MLIRQRFIQLSTQFSRQPTALLNLIAAKPRAVPLSAHADIPNRNLISRLIRARICPHRAGVSAWSIHFAE
jgi:hypothetical protein